MRRNRQESLTDFTPASSAARQCALDEEGKKKNNHLAVDVMKPTQSRLPPPELLSLTCKAGKRLMVQEASCLKRSRFIV